MNCHTPTTQEVKEWYADSIDRLGGGAEFDRWHADEIRKAKAQAWEEGHSLGWTDAQEAHDVSQHMDRAEWPLRTTNPYESEES